MNEKFVAFGQEDSHLSGIFHAGNPAANPQEKPAILLWNVGVYHRTGPQRQHVELARQLAAFGFHVLRFDLSGLGDSGMSDSELLGEGQEVQDIRSAMDFMESISGSQRFILIGFCSSAANAHPTAVVDPRVRGLIMIDGYGYRTLKHRFIHFSRRLFSPRHYQNFLGNLGKRLFVKHGLRAQFFRSFPAQADIQKDILGLLQRGVQLQYIYTGGVADYFNYEQQFWDMFPDLPKKHANLQLAYLPHANHLFADVKIKQEYFTIVKDFIFARFSHDSLG